MFIYQANKLGIKREGASIILDSLFYIALEAFNSVLLSKPNWLKPVSRPGPVVFLGNLNGRPQMKKLLLRPK
jgi:hypothetical protein